MVLLLLTTTYIWFKQELHSFPSTIQSYSSEEQYGQHYISEHCFDIGYLKTKTEILVYTVPT